MGAFITRYCECGAVLENFYGGSAKITGVPFLECEVCGKIYDRSSIASEWRLMSSVHRISVAVTTLARKILILGGYLYVAIVFLMGWLLGVEGDAPIGPLLLKSVPVWILAAAPLVLWLYKRDIGGQIERSETRMKDPEYLSKLKSLGYLKD